MAKVRVKIEGKSVLIVVPIRRGYGGPVFDENPEPGSTPWSPPRRPRGRPREDAKAARIAELHQERESWRSIAGIVSEEFERQISWDACRNLYKSRKQNPEEVRGETVVPVFVESPKSMQQRVLRVPKRRGRPRSDEMRFEGGRMHWDGSSWAQVAIKLNAKHGKNISADAWRKLCREPKAVPPWRILDLNIIRGIKFS